MTKRKIIVGGSIEEAAKRVAEAWNRAERGETVEPELGAERAQRLCSFRAVSFPP